ncbi:hypothetical protein BH20BAC1_BH20BAC1_16780 [soil metagenome]|jgi:quinol monooxygenase YgiN
MTKLKVAAICCSLCLLLSCNQAQNDKDASETEVAAFTDTDKTQEKEMPNLQAQIPTEKSIHLFDMPDGVTEAEWSAAIKDINAVIAKIGYPNAGYAFYKAKDDSVKTNRYYFEGVWPAGDDYKKIHDDPEYKKAAEKLGPLYDKIKAVEMYRKVVRVE